MNPSFHLTLAGSRECELRTVARRPDRLMAHVLELEGDDSRPARRIRRTHHATRSRRRSS